MSTRRLAVVLYGEVVATIDQAQAGGDPVLTYEPAYVEQGRVPLGLRLPVGAGVHRGRNVVSYLEGLLPEDLGTRNRWGDLLGVDPGDAVGLLARMGWDCPGAVQFCRPDELDDLRARSGEHVPVSDAEIAARLRTLRTADEPSWTLPDEHWSLAGQQAKFALAHVDGRWHEAHGSAPTTHILKPGIERLAHQGLVEHATMQAAAAVDVDVAHTELLRFEDEVAVVVERYDRVVPDGAPVVRIHQEDLCSATGRLPARKYEAHGGPGVRDFALLVDRHVTDKAMGRWAIGDFVALNYIAGAPDGHAKNVSVLLAPDDVSVAPLYDLATGLAYDTAQVERRIAVSLAGQRALGSVVGHHWDKVAQLLSLPAEAYRGRVRAIATGFTDAFVDALEAIGTPEATTVRDRTAVRLEAHTTDVLARLDDPTRP